MLGDSFEQMVYVERLNYVIRSVVGQSFSIFPVLDGVVRRMIGMCFISFRSASQTDKPSFPSIMTWHTIRLGTLAVSRESPSSPLSANSTCFKLKTALLLYINDCTFRDSRPDF